MPARIMNLRRRSLLQAASLSALPVAAFASGAREIRVVLGEEGERQREALEGLRRRLSKFTVQPPGSQAKPLAQVAFGAAAFEAAISTSPDVPTLCLFASRQGYEQAVLRIGASSKPASAIYAEPSPTQQMRLIAALYKRPIAVGAFVSAQSRHVAPLWAEAAREHHLAFKAVEIESGASLARSMNRLAPVDVLLVFPDASLYTPTSLRELLESTYRRRQPVIGFSQSLVRAGTLASAYTDVEDTIAQLDAMLEQIAAGRASAPQYPRYWRVAVNNSVARSLDVVIDEAVQSLGDRP